MSRIIKNCPCTLEVWSGPDEPILKEWNMYFNCKNEIKEYLNNKLQEFKGDMQEEGGLSVSLTWADEADQGTEVKDVKLWIFNADDGSLVEIGRASCRERV